VSLLNQLNGMNEVGSGGSILAKMSSLRTVYLVLWWRYIRAFKTRIAYRILLWTLLDDKYSDGRITLKEILHEKFVRIWAELELLSMGQMVDLT